MRRSIALLLLAAAWFAAAAHAGPSYTLTLTRGSRLMIDAKINGHPIRALLDSAAEATLLDRRFARTLKLNGGKSVAGQGSGQAAFDATMIDGVKL